MKIVIGFLAMLISVNAYAAAGEDCSVNFANPYYNGGRHGERERVIIPNGSCLLLAASSTAGEAVRSASALNDTPNPLGLNHSAIVINDYPQELLDFLAGEIFPLFPFAQEELAVFGMELDGINRDELTPFLVETWDVIKVNLLDTALSWSGNYYIRPLKEEIRISRDQTRDFLLDVLMKPYASYGELLGCIRGVNKEDLTKLFCSELSSWFYKKLGLIDKGINVSNILPEQLSSRAGEYDLLKGIAEPEVVLKWEHDFSKETEGVFWRRAILKPLSFLSSCVLF